MAARAIIHLDELRRWARVARDERVAINGRIEPDGAVTINVTALIDAPIAGEDDLDARLDAFAGKR